MLPLSGVHPQLNRLTPYDQGRNIELDGAWCGGWMKLRDDVATMSSDGQRHVRASLPGVTADDERRVYYFLAWPNLLLSIHPDYVMTHQVTPMEPGRSRVVCEWLFHPEALARPEFDPSDAVEFWDLTNRQDWKVCELQQRGTASDAYTPGRYTLMEDMVHAFDLMCRRLRPGRHRHPVRAAPRQMAPPGQAGAPARLKPRNGTSLRPTTTASRATSVAARPSQKVLAMASEKAW